MSYPHLTPETANECSRAAYAYDPDCYCTIYWACADYLPRPQYQGKPTKWLEAAVWRCIGPEQPDRFVVATTGESGPEVLRNLQAALAAIVKGEYRDPSLLASAEAQQQLSATLRHPMLGTGMLLHTLDKLLPNLPAQQVFDLTKRLQRVINNRVADTYQPPQGAGWVPTAQQTTKPLNCWSF